MSLVDVSNRKDQIEMNDLEFLVWDDGWNGGTWNNWNVVSNPNNFDFYLVSNDNIVNVEVVVKDEHGVDCDMGHRYYWTSRRVYVKDAGQFGETLVDSRQISNGFKLMYCGKC